MNKKLTNVLRTNVTLYFICLVLFALAAIPFDVRLAIGEGVAAVSVITPSYWRMSQEALYRHYASVIHATTLPVFAYNLDKIHAAGWSTSMTSDEAVAKTVEAVL
mgnify:CR=1 FL=1